MHILFVTATYAPSINGIAISIEKLKHELEKLGHTVTVLAPENNKADSNEKNVIRYPSLRNPLIKDYPFPLVPNLKLTINLLKNNPPNIVHVHHPFYTGSFALKLANYFHVPLVYTYHTRYEEYAKNFLHLGIPSIIEKITLSIVDQFIKQTNLVISPSKTLTQEIIARLPKINITTLPSGISKIPKVSLSKKEIIKQLNLPPNKKILLSVSRVSKEKNLSLLIESAKLLNNKYLMLIVGGGNFENDLLKQVEINHLQDKVRVIGSVDHQKLGMYYQVADTFVYTSITETQGLIFLEALSFGLPIVAVKSAASSEWVKSSLGILTANSAQSFVSGISQIEKIDKIKQTKDAQELVSEFTIEKVTQRILNCYLPLSTP